MPGKGTARRSIRIDDELWVPALALAAERDDNLSGTGACDTGPSGGYPRAAGGGRLKITETALGHLFYLAQAEVEDAAKLQPGEWLVHTNDVQAVLNDLHKRILEHPHAD